MYSRIVVPLDGSQIAEEALVQARELAKMLQVPLHLVRVADAHTLERVAGTGIGLDYVAIGALLEEEVADAKSYIADRVKELSDEGLTVSSAILTGPVSRSIVDSLQEGDLLAMTSHGRTGISRWFLGSVAEDVIRHATVPVLLTRHLGKND